MVGGKSFNNVSRGIWFERTLRLLGLCVIIGKKSMFELDLKTFRGFYNIFESIFIP